MSLIAWRSLAAQKRPSFTCARILASREGRQLPATTLPPKSSGMAATGWLMLAGVIAAGVFFGPKLLEQVGVKA